MSGPGRYDSGRYERAAAYAPAKFVARLQGRFVDGYWLDNSHYFFSVIEANAEGAMERRPKIANAYAGSVAEVIEFAELATLISAAEKTPLSGADLAAASYDMPDLATLVVTLGRRAWHISTSDRRLIKAEVLGSAAALYSPDGRHAIRLKDDAVWIRDRVSDTERQLSPDGEILNCYGAAPESAIDPVSRRQHMMPVGMWSANSEWFVTHRIDERNLPETGLVEHVPAGGGRPVVHRYKVSGPEADLAMAEFVAFHIPTGRMVFADRTVSLPLFSPFTTKQCWFSDNCFYFLAWGRFAETVELVEMSLESGSTRVVHTERTETGWLDVHPIIASQPIIRVLPRSREFIWWSQSSDHGHLYLYDLDTGKLKNAITQGKWEVREVVHIDQGGRRVFFLGSGFADEDDPGSRRLCMTSFDGSGCETLLAIGDVSSAADPVSAIDQYKPFRPNDARKGMSPDGSHIVLQTGGVDRATQTILFDTSTKAMVVLARGDVDAVWNAPLPRSFEVLAADGDTRLFGAMYLPDDFDPAKSYPVVDFIYPGPQINWFARRMMTSIGLLAQSVAELGAIVIVLETRGMPNRSRCFHQAGNGKMLEPQLSDHVAAIEQLCERHSFLDRGRVGIFGSSGGGHAAARAMFDYPGMFKVGVSICGNHDNRNYVSLWLDKYGGRPGSIERDEQSNIGAAYRLQGKLFLIHGDMDENVHVGHTLALTAALIDAGKNFDQLIVPRIGHSVLSDSPYAVQRIWDFFVRHLIGAEPPSDFDLRWTREDAAAAAAMSAETW